MADVVGDLKLVQEGLLRKLVAAGKTGMLRSELLHGDGLYLDRRRRSLRRLELAGMIRAERMRTQSGRKTRSERWFALVADAALERGIDAYGEPYGDDTVFR
jgi:hypothetical protein